MDRPQCKGTLEVNMLTIDMAYFYRNKCATSIWVELLCLGRLNWHHFGYTCMYIPVEGSWWGFSLSVLSWGRCLSSLVAVAVAPPPAPAPLLAWGVLDDIRLPAPPRSRRPYAYCDIVCLCVRVRVHVNHVYVVCMQALCMCGLVVMIVCVCLLIIA